MPSSPPHSDIQLLTLLYQQGKFHEASKLSFKLWKSTSTERSGQQWVYIARLLFQCHFELLMHDRIEFVYDEMLQNAGTPDPIVRSHILYLLGIWQMAKNSPNQAKTLFGFALEDATTNTDYEYIARSLHGLAFAAILENKVDQAWALIDKALTLLRVINHVDLEISCLFIKGLVLIGRKQHDEGLDLFWLCYEKSKREGLNYLAMNVLVQLADTYLSMGKPHLAETYTTLIKTGLDEKQQPRLHAFFQQRLGPLNTAPFERDLIIYTNNFSIKVHRKGHVTFNNQHILFDLVTALARRPGERHSKVMLIESVWKLSYDPALHDNLIYVSIKRLRTLIEPNPDSPRYILRDRMGYYIPRSISITIIPHGAIHE